MEMDKKTEKKDTNEKQKQSLNGFARYSGMAFQIGGAIALGGLLGNWLDKQFDVPRHLFMTLFLLFGVFLGLYSVFKDLLKK
jgi:F0F1-type ATP synthase assembly protein I